MLFSWKAVLLTTAREQPLLLRSPNLASQWVNGSEKIILDQNWCKHSPFSVERMSLNAFHLSLHIPDVSSFLSSYIHDGIDNVLSWDLCLRHDVFVLYFITPSFSLLFGKRRSTLKAFFFISGLICLFSAFQKHSGWSSSSPLFPLLLSCNISLFSLGLTLWLGCFEKIPEDRSQNMLKVHVKK